MNIRNNLEKSDIIDESIIQGNVVKVMIPAIQFTTELRNVPAFACWEDLIWS